MRKKQKTKKNFNSTAFSLFLSTVLFLAVFFGFQNTLAQAVLPWAKGIWNDTTGYLKDASNNYTEQKSGIPTIGHLSSKSGTSSCPQGAPYGVALDGDEASSPRTLRGAAWFGIGSNSDSNGACEADSPSLGWLNFDQGSPGGCPGDCWSARWNKKDGGTGFEGTVTGWAQIESMMAMPKADGTTAENGWVRIYGAEVNATGEVIATVDKKNYAWNSGAETEPNYRDLALGGNSGLGWIDLTGLKINNCTGAAGCRTVQYCEGQSATAGKTINDLCVPGSTGLNILDDTHWSCGNGCETKSCAATIVEPEQGECGNLNGKSLCGKNPAPGDYCATGTYSSVSTSSLSATWTCGRDACGSTGYQATCNANTSCGWVETNP